MNTLELAIIAIVVFIVGAIGFYVVCESKVKNQMAIAGWDVNDIQVFLDKTGSSWFDFRDSDGLKKQYQIFSHGQSSSFIDEAIAKKRADEAQATANMAVGLSAASMANRR